jgi:hypothetical protein
MDNVYHDAEKGLIIPAVAAVFNDGYNQAAFVILRQQTSRMLKKSASGVLASFRGSTYRSVRLASSLAAALLNGLFEHPELLRHQRHSARFQQSVMYKPSFSADR